MERATSPRLESNVTVRSGSGVTSSNYTARACNLTLISAAGLLKTLLHAPAAVPAAACYRSPTAPLDCTLQYSRAASPADHNASCGGCYDTLSADHHCALQYASSTSPVLTGDLGVPTFPRLVRFEVDSTRAAARACTRTRTHAHAPTLAHTHTHSHTHTRTHAHTYVCAHTNMHIWETQTHARSCALIIASRWMTSTTATRNTVLATCS